jgi:D-lyxose ketol-isomerase
MKTPEERERLKQKYYNELLKPSGIALTEEEWRKSNVGDFHLDTDEVGMLGITYFNTDRLCGRELLMFAGQTCPEHRHPPIGDYLGKEEIFRCRYGQVYVYVPGEPVAQSKAHPPKGQEAYYTVWHEIVLNPGEMYILKPNTLHWFQAGPEGVVLSEFSTHAYDLEDIYTDPNIQAARDAQKKAQK